MKNLIILKIGGSVITDKFSKIPKVNLKNLKRISTEISHVYNKKKNPLVIVHGVGPFGHVIVHKTGIDRGIKNKKQLKYFIDIKIKGNDIILSGEITFRGEPRMVIGTIKDGKEEK